MDKRKAFKLIDAALVKVNNEISGSASQGRIAGGMASEGYNGGYRDALEDIKLLLNDVQPSRRNYWRDETT